MSGRNDMLTVDVKIFQGDVFERGRECKVLTSYERNALELGVSNFRFYTPFY